MLLARAVHTLRLQWDLSGQCWWSQSWFSAGLQVWLAQHCMSTGSWSGNFVLILKGLSGSVLPWWIRGRGCLLQEQLVWHHVMYFLCHTSLSYLLVDGLDIPAEGKRSIWHVIGLPAVRPDQQAFIVNQIPMSRLANYNLLTFAPPVSNPLIS